MKNKLLKDVIVPKNRGIIVLCLIIILVITSAGIIGCNKTVPNQTTQPALDETGDEINTELAGKTTNKTETTKEKSIDAYNDSKGYKVVMNSGVGFDIYIPQKERENNQSFFDNLNKQSRLNGYDFSAYLDKPLCYTAMAINSDDSTKDITFLCHDEQIVGVWIDASNKEHLEVRRKLLQYNFVYDAEELLQYKSNYAGDNSNVVHLMYSLPYVNGIKPVGCELQTDSEPYGLIINCQGYGTKERASLPYFKNAAVIFSLIGNVGIVTFNIENNDGKIAFTYTREQIDNYFKKDIRKHSKNKADFAGFIMEVQDASEIGL